MIKPQILMILLKSLQDLLPRSSYVTAQSPSQPALILLLFAMVSAPPERFVHVLGLSPPNRKQLVFRNRSLAFEREVFGKQFPRSFFALVTQHD
jgi:hypothetical protein